MNRILYVFSAGVALAMGSAALAQAPSQPPDADLVAGQVLYSENCASCHGAELAGQTDWQIVGDDGLLPLLSPRVLSVPCSFSCSFFGS